MSGPSVIKESHYFPIHMLKVLRSLALEKVLELSSFPLKDLPCPWQLLRENCTPSPTSHCHLSILMGQC